MVSGASVVVKGERKLNWQYAPVVKLANTRDLGSRAERLAGSIPVRSIQSFNALKYLVVVEYVYM